MATGIVVNPGMRKPIALCLVTLCAACSREVIGKPSTSVRQTGVAVGQAATAVPTLMDTNIGPDTAGCDVIAKLQFDQPLELVRAYVRRDSAGDFLKAGPQLFELFACPGHLGGGDEIIVATDARIAQLTPRADTAEFLITYHRWGRVASDSTGVTTVFKTDSGTDSVTAGAVHTRWGWRFADDVGNPHLPPRVLLDSVHGAWEAGSRDALAALADRLETH